MADNLAAEALGAIAWIGFDHGGIMRSITAAAAVTVAALGLSAAQAADGGPTRLHDHQLDRVTAAGTLFIGVLSGDEVLFAHTFHDVPVSSEQFSQFRADGVTLVVIATEGDVLIPPPPFPQ